MKLLVLGFLVRIMISSAATNSQDLAALVSLTNGWGNLPSSWSSSDPCSSWAGISCTNSRITSIILSSLGLTGQLTGDLAALSELTSLDLSYNPSLTGQLPPNIGELGQLQELTLVGCGFSGQVPDSIGSLKQLTYLSLNSNNFNGNIPPSIGNLAKLYWLDVSNNQLSGSIPVSNATVPGLDMLVNTKHFHFGQNKLSGTVPSRLFSSEMTLIHTLFDNNQLTGSIPSTLGLVQSLEAVRFDSNSLTGNVPSNITNITSLQVLILSNNQLGGPTPDLTGLSNLNYVDLSNNTFDLSDVPSWFSSLETLTTLMMERTNIRGEIPVTLFSFSDLQTVNLKSNRLNGTLNIGASYSSQLELVDLQTNDITEFTPKTYNFTLILVGNPYCLETGTTGSYCTIPQTSNSSTYSTPTNNCISPDCLSGQVSSPNCKCAYPYTGTLLFKAPTFSNIGNSTRYKLLETSLMGAFLSLYLPVDSVSLSDIAKNSLGYLTISLAAFPSDGVFFNTTTITLLGFLFSNQTYSPPSGFGPYTFLADKYTVLTATGQSNSSRIGIIVGVVIGCSVLLLLLLLLGWRAYYHKRSADAASRTSISHASWDPSVRHNDIPQLKGARWFSFEEIRKCTSNFSEANNIGSGGYGKVYKGILSDGQLVAVKRAQPGSMQGAGEFKTEIELLSRVHHKNLVNLIGFCLDMGEQMLVYEFLPNGSLMDSLTGKSGIRLDWVRRMRVALGSAKGLAYLHELADPPIIHRDIKSNNILLDERLTAKVADFGLCKAFSNNDKAYMTTQVKGTMGYLDPEYYMTQQLTEKSDVYSFGVVMLELISGRRPIQEGKYIVREVKSVLDKTKDLYNLHGIIDPAISSVTSMLVGFEKFVDLALSCVEDSAVTRPTMSEVVKGIENIMQIAGVNPNADSAPTSGSYVGSSTGNIYGDDSLFQYSGSIPSSKIEPQ